MRIRGSVLMAAILAAACHSSTAPAPTVLGTWTFTMDTLSGMPRIVPRTFNVTLQQADEGPVGMLPVLEDRADPGLNINFFFDSEQVVKFTSRIDTTLGTNNVLVHGGDTLVAFTSIKANYDCGALAFVLPINADRTEARGWLYLVSRTDFTTVCGDSALVTATKPR
ncbi:MAG TPA: hypothetical protein VJS20_05825 [Gemmatimonadales bacterium]|nr:hypothetical protein [Gemmatimonadales bacterium]